MSELDKGIYLQIGIVSFGAKLGCNQGYPHVFTRVGFYQDWINRTITFSNFASRYKPLSLFVPFVVILASLASSFCIIACLLSHFFL